jgi:hypothetical protein
MKRKGIALSAYLHKCGMWAIRSVNRKRAKYYKFRSELYGKVK